MAITYADKVQNAVNVLPVTEQWRAVDANEVKTVVNAIEAALDVTIGSITGAVSLVSADLGKLHVITGTTADYTVDLPTAVGNTGKSIVLKGAGAFTKVATIQGVSGQTIDGYSDRKIASTGMITLLSDGANWVVVNEVGSWIPYTPVLAGWSADPPIDRSVYFWVGKMVTVQVHTSANGTSSSATKTITVPFNAAAGASQLGHAVTAVNNGTASTAGGLIATRASSNTVDLYANLLAGSWATSGGCRVSFILTYMME